MVNGREPSGKFFDFLPYIYTPAVEWIATVAEMPAILDYFLLATPIHKHSYRGGGWGW